MDIPLFLYINHWDMYVGQLMTFTIIHRLSGDPIGGVVVSATNGGGADTTDPNGFYEVWVDYDWSGTLIPEKVDCIMDPNRTEFVHVLDHHENQKYTARSIYDLDGNGLIDLGDLRAFSDYWLLSGLGLPCDYTIRTKMRRFIS